MRLRLLVCLIVVCKVPFAVANPDAHDRHVVFENSATDDSCFQTETSFVAPSELALLRNKLPASVQQFVSPPNSLRLAWRSASGGDWRVTLRAVDRNGPAQEFTGDTLSMWCYADEELTEEDSPLIGVQDFERNGLPEVRLLTGIQKLPAKQWTRLNFPIAAFAGRYEDTDARHFDPSKLARVTLTQDSMTASRTCCISTTCESSMAT